MASYSNLARIPEIDASILNDEPSVERKKLLHLLVASLSTHGAIRITGHGVSACKIQRAFDSVTSPQIFTFDNFHTTDIDDQSREFFHLPKQLKLSAAGSGSDNGLHRGYMIQKSSTGGHTACEHVSGGNIQ